MSIVSYADWTFDVDVEATERYYQQFSVADPNSKAYRNFQKNFEKMTDEEMQFFGSLGINPLCFDMTIDNSYENTVSGSGKYFFFGKCIKRQRTDFTGDNVPPENSIITLTGLGCRVGRSIFTFHDIDTRWPDVIPDDMPEGCICIQVEIESLPWLLKNREGKGIVHRPLERWQIFRRLYWYAKKKSAYKLWRAEAEENFENVLKQLNIEYSVMSRREVTTYMKQWFLEYLPPGADRKELESQCLRNKEYGTYLWHMFTWGSLESEDKDHANICFDEMEKVKCVILLENHKLGFVLKDGSALTSEVLDPYQEVYVTAEDFSWTYVHTHEDGWIGPFFHRRNVQK